MTAETTPVSVPHGVLADAVSLLDALTQTLDRVARDDVEEPGGVGDDARELAERIRRVRAGLLPDEAPTGDHAESVREWSLDLSFALQNGVPDVEDGDVVSL